MSFLSLSYHTTFSTQLSASGAHPERRSSSRPPASVQTHHAAWQGMVTIPPNKQSMQAVPNLSPLWPAWAASVTSFRPPSAASGAKPLHPASTHLIAGHSVDDGLTVLKHRQALPLLLDGPSILAPIGGGLAQGLCLPLGHFHAL